MTLGDASSLRGRGMKLDGVGAVSIVAGPISSKSWRRFSRSAIKTWLGDGVVCLATAGTGADDWLTFNTAIKTQAAPIPAKCHRHEKRTSRHHNVAWCMGGCDRAAARAACRISDRHPVGTVFKGCC